MATTRMTFGAVLSTVSDAATTVSTVLNAGTKAVSMLDVFVTNAATKQADRATIDMETYRERLIEDTAVEDTERQKKILAFCKQDSETAELYKANQERLHNLFNKSK